MSLRAEFVIRNASESDVAAILALCAADPNAAHWDEAEYSRLIACSHEERALVLVAERGEGLIGSVVLQQTGVDWELENIVVANQYRRRGVGHRLLDQAIAHIQSVHGERLLLEVRASNTVARVLYAKYGFEQIGRRKDYYRDPLEDALIFALALPPIGRT